MAKSLEKKAKPILLRPHHLQRLFYDWVGMTDRQLKKMLTNHNYGGEFAQYALDIYNHVKANHPVRIVHAKDTLCERCKRVEIEAELKRKNPKFVPAADPERCRQRDYLLPGMSKPTVPDDFGFYEGTFTPLQLLERGIAKLESRLGLNPDEPKEYWSNEKVSMWWRREAYKKMHKAIKRRVHGRA